VREGNIFKLLGKKRQEKKHGNHSLGEYPDWR
jgi:hypothetical protein